MAASLSRVPRRPMHDRRLSGGTAEYLEVMGDLPSGPKSFAELTRWPTFLLEKALGGDGGPQLRRRLEAVLQCGLVSHTDFSGKARVEVVPPPPY